MADDADRAGDNTDKFEEDAIKAISKASERRDLIPVGICYNSRCLSEVPQHHIFCDSTCSVEWHHEQARKKANGHG
ncbi:MAG TPA: hypothetical protein VIY48_09445 [Candidatus Paceibacterota bacterium]